MTIHDDLLSGEAPIGLGDLTGESYIPRRGGKTLHRSIPFRWASRGTRGIRLEVVRTPSGLCTTRSAVLRFFAALTDPAPQPPRRTHRRREADIAAAERELAAAGVM